MASQAPSGSEAAIREVARGYELALRLNSLIGRLGSLGDGRADQAAHLSQDLLHSLSLALSLLRSADTATATSPSPAADEVSSAAPAAGKPGDPAEKVAAPAAADPKQVPRRERKILESVTTVTCAPHVDGYQWRKYGEKKINNTKFPRWYYRCTHKDDRGCLATKQVQQKDSTDDPPIFQVTYIKQHTCRSQSLPMGMEPQLQAASPQYRPYILNFGSDSNGIQHGRPLFPSSAASTAAAAAKRDHQGEIVSRRRDGISLSLNHPPSPEESSNESTQTSPCSEESDAVYSQREPKSDETHPHGIY